MPKIEHPVLDDATTVQWKGPLAGTDHAVLRVSDLDLGLAWYQRLLGLAVADQGPGRVFLASPITGRTVLGLSEGGRGLEYVSFQARTTDAFERLSAQLDAADIALKRNDGATRPGVSDALRFSLPTGHLVEIVLGGDDAPGVPVAGEYRPGSIDVRSSHVQVRALDVKGLTDVLGLVGFRSSTFVPLPDSDDYFIQFLRANEFHHQVAILTGEPGTHHVALEVDEVDFWRLLDNLAVQRLRAEYGPLRHHEGNMVSFYIRDPFGNRLEVTSTMEIVGYDYPPTLADQEPYYHMNMWGPQPPESWEQEWT